MTVRTRTACGFQRRRRNISGTSAAVPLRRGFPSRRAGRPVILAAMSEMPPHLAVALAERYRLERPLGEGGMATVYLARDLKHNRNVALKVLRPELAAVLGAERFLKEIETTANLQHPNILPLFDSGEAEGMLYYVMPYVEGETLRQRLQRERTLAPDEAVRLAADVAEGLQAAHDQGVIHRDIKPANILLSRGRAVLADFGIAYATLVTRDTRLTQTGSSLGTVGYMSPEQAAGDAAVDHRTDIYSLGAVLFEMLTGRPPYGGASFLAVLAKQATEPVPSVRGLCPGATPSLERAVTKALSRDPAHRFASAATFAEAIVARSVGSKEADLTTLVVLPFVNRSGDPENEYFSDGLTEEVISDLSRISALRVISRNSAMSLKDTAMDTATLSRELGVSHLVTGSVRRAGDALRVTAELVEAKSDLPIWSEKYSGTVEDVFGIQEEISRKIVGALKVKLTATEDRQVSERSIEDVVAYDCYLRARQEMYRWTPDALDRALALVNQALSIVGDSPLLLATAGQVHWTRVNINLVAAEDGLPLADALVERALAVDPEHHLAIFVRGLVAGMRGRTEAALEDLYRANRLRPGDANVMAELCRYSNTAGLRKHWAWVERLTQIDPLTPVTQLVVSTYRWMNGPQEDAAAPCRRAIEMAPGPSMIHVVAGWQLAAAGFRDEAAAILKETGVALAAHPLGAVASFLHHALRGEEAAACRWITPETERVVRNEFACRMLAAGFALMGRTEDGVRWLRLAVRSGFMNYPNLANAPFLDGLRGAPEFQQLLAELRPRWEALVAWEERLT